VLAGNHKLMERFEISFPLSQEIGTLLYLAIDQSYSGYLVIADKRYGCLSSILIEIRDEPCGT
uniref:hypothetical protein n=1 Tax=Enterococcus faecium TaxID=1352 RepID=UPI00292F26B4